MDDGGMMNRDMGGGGRGGYSGRGGFRGGGGGAVMGRGGAGVAGSDSGHHVAGDHSPHHGHHGHGVPGGGPTMAFKAAPEFEMKGNDFPALPGLDEPRKVASDTNDSGSKRWESKG